MLKSLFQVKKARCLVKEEWITKHGSKELKLRIKHQYNHESLYAKERCEKEFPKFGGFPFTSYVETKRPSKKALRLLEKVKNNPYFDEEKHTVRIILHNVKWHSVLHGCAFEQISEAILLENYLDSYRIWQPIYPI